MKNFKLILTITLAVLWASCTEELTQGDTQNGNEETANLPSTPNEIDIELPSPGSPLFAPLNPTTKENVLKKLKFEVEGMVNKKSRNMNNARLLPATPTANITFVPVITNNYDEEWPGGRGASISTSEPFKKDTTNLFFYQKVGSDLINTSIAEYNDFKGFKPEFEKNIRRIQGDASVDKMIKSALNRSESEKWNISICDDCLFEELQYAFSHAEQEADLFIYRNPRLSRVCYFKDGKIFVCKKNYKLGIITAIPLKKSDVVTAISYDIIM